jgi:hypothetical protein
VALDQRRERGLIPRAQEAAQQFGVGRAGGRVAAGQAPDVLK